jgi:hypothetical protein
LSGQPLIQIVSSFIPSSLYSEYRAMDLAFSLEKSLAGEVLHGINGEQHLKSAGIQEQISGRRGEFT